MSRESGSQGLKPKEVELPKGLLGNAIGMKRPGEKPSEEVKDGVEPAEAISGGELEDVWAESRKRKKKEVEKTERLTELDKMDIEGPKGLKKRFEELLDEYAELSGKEYGIKEKQQELEGKVKELESAQGKKEDEIVGKIREWKLKDEKGKADKELEKIGGLLDENSNRKLEVVGKLGNKLPFGDRTIDDMERIAFDKKLAAIEKIRGGKS